MRSHGVRIAGALLLAAACGGSTDGAEAPASTPGEQEQGVSGGTQITLENKLPGTRAWQIRRTALNHEIEGYASAVSVKAGDTISLAVNSQGASFSYQVFRMGYYGGMGGRLVAQHGPVAGVSQPAASFDRVTGLVEAHWAFNESLEARDAQGKAWVTGVYLVLLTRSDGLQAYSIFVVRDDSRDADVKMQLSTATYQAYNSWGGESLYTTTHGMSGGKARKVSYSRPYAATLGSGSGHFLSLEYPEVLWLEQRGYDVQYTTNFDVGSSAGSVGHPKLFLSVGHDEYATLEALERLEAAATQGVNLAFLSGDTMYWAVRYEDSPAGKERVQVCYKDHVSEDPKLKSDPMHATTKFRNPPISRPENELLGVMSNGDAIPSHSSVDWIVKDSSHWLYAGTGLHDGEAIPRTMGFEWDGMVNNGRAPAGLVTLSASPVHAQSGLSYQNAVIYQRGLGFVFAAGIINFARDLTINAHFSQMMANLLAHAGAAPAGP